MSFVLQVDAERWRAHVQGVADAVAAASGSPVVPVVKGNGYGIGMRELLAEAAHLGASTIAVGTAFEAREALALTAADLLVLEPFEPADTAAAQVWASLPQDRVIRTVASAHALAALQGSSARIVLEALTSMRRFGMSADALARVLGDASSLRCEGLALHEPIVQPDGSRAAEVLAWANAVPLRPLWVSHLSDAEVQHLRAALPEVQLRCRIGTRLWLGDRGALRALGTVLAVHQGDARVGYRQRHGRGTLVVVSGGTSHGIGLVAPAATNRQRVAAAGTGLLDAAGRSLSPFTWAGKQRWFAEPPHQHVSMLWLPRGCAPPKVGAQLEAEVRFTTSRFDAVLGL